MLSPDQIKARDGLLTASRVACLMRGDEEKIYRLWQQLVGDPAFPGEEDLSGVWPVQLGVATEDLNLAWYARKHGPVSRQGEVVVHNNGWAAATLDGWDVERKCPVECKHVGGREPLDVIIDRYYAQIHWQMMVTGAGECALSVIMGANAPVVEFIPHHREYAQELSARAGEFMACVRSLTPPVPAPPVPVPAVAKVKYDMQTSNSWVSAAADWLESRAAAKKCVAAERTLKELVPADAIEASGFGVVITRNRAGHLALREAK